MTVILRPSCFVADATVLTLDRKELRHLFVRGPRLSGRKLTVSSCFLAHGWEPAELGRGFTWLPGDSLPEAQLPPAAGLLAQEGVALTPYPQGAPAASPPSGERPREQLAP